MLEFLDNFTLYGDDVGYMLNGLYAEIDGRGVAIVDDPAGTPGKALRVTFDGINNGQTSWRRVLSSTQPIVGCAFRLWLEGLPSNNDGKTRHIEFRDVANNNIAALLVNSTGAMRFRINGHGDYASPAPNITANGWWHIEVKYAHTGANTGSFEVRVEGQTVLEGTDVAASDMDVAQIAQSRDNISGDGRTFMKDFVIWNGAGAYNKDFMGSVLVYSMIPDSDVALNWTPSIGAAGFSILDNSPPNDGQYITAGTPPPDAYVATVTNLPVNVTSVRGLMTFVRATKVDGGDAFLQTGLISGVAEIDGSNRPITVTPTWWTDVFEVDPATAAPFSPAAADLVQLKINRTA